MRKLNVFLTSSVTVAVALCLLFPGTALAQTGDFVTKNGTLQKYNGSGGIVTLPTSVKVIGTSAFLEAKNITKVIIPKGTVKIDVGAFKDCANLTEVTIPITVRSIGRDAFNGCAALTSIEIPPSVTSIGSNAFSNCPNLKTATISNPSACGALFAEASLENVIVPSIVKTIDKVAFADARFIKNVTLPNTITKISEQAFDNCESLTSITIPNSVTALGLGAFSGCKSLTSLNIPKSVKSIDMGLVCGCSALTELTVENGNPNFVAKDGVLYPKDMSVVLAIAEGRYSNFTFPNNITVVKRSTFIENQTLKKVTLPNTLERIETNAFFGCDNLKDITIPKSVKLIGRSAFTDSEAKDHTIPTLHGAKGSVAEQYAKSHNIPFKVEPSLGIYTKPVKFRAEKAEAVNCRKTVANDGNGRMIFENRGSTITFSKLPKASSFIIWCSGFSWYDRNGNEVPLKLGMYINGVFSQDIVFQRNPSNDDDPYTTVKVDVPQNASLMFKVNSDGNGLFEMEAIEF